MFYVEYYDVSTSLLLTDHILRVESENQLITVGKSQNLPLIYKWKDKRKYKHFNCIRYST